MKVTYYSKKGPNIKIAIMADIHNSPIPIALGLLKKERPDLILLPGDFRSGHLSIEAHRMGGSHQPKFMAYDVVSTKEMLSTLSEIAAVAPAFMSLGNHENRWNDVDYEIVRQSCMPRMKASFHNIRVAGMRIKSCLYQPVRGIQSH